MIFPTLTDASGALVSINPAHIVDVKPEPYNKAEPVPGAIEAGIKSKIVWRWPGDGANPPMMTQTYCRETVAEIIAMLNGGA